MGSRGLAVGGVLVLLASGGGAVALARHGIDTSPASAAAAPDGPRVVTGRVLQVESGSPGTTFLPLGTAPRDGRTLSAQHAYNALLRNPSPLTPIPPNVRAYYGNLTDPGASPMAVDMAVWAFTMTSGCVVVGGQPAPGDPTPAPPPSQQCRMWEFVNARSGHDLGVVAQEVLAD